MGRIMAIDYGLKRVGPAVTDPLQIIASALETIPTQEALNYLKNYTKNEAVDIMVVGLPINLDGNETDATAKVRGFVGVLKNTFAGINIVTHDERFTSKMASQALFASGMSKKNRQIKGNIDKMAAAIILQSYLEQKSMLGL